MYLPKFWLLPGRNDVLVVDFGIDSAGFNPKSPNLKRAAGEVDDGIRFLGFTDVPRYYTDWVHVKGGRSQLTGNSRKGRDERIQEEKRWISERDP